VAFIAQQRGETAAAESDRVEGIYRIMITQLAAVLQDLHANA
jgi:hypothetical protein